VSLGRWEKDGKMSPKRSLTVSELVQKYRQMFPNEERRNLRRRLRIEKPELFKDNPSNLRKLDRHLQKEFKNNLNKDKKEAIKPKIEVPLSDGKWNPLPDFSFSPKFEEAHRKIREPFEVDTDEPPKFPVVAFNWHNFSSYQLGVRFEVRVFLGGKYLGLINDPKGYYNGKTLSLVEPSRGLRDGRFWLPKECGNSSEETTIDVKAIILDQNDTTKKEYKIIRSWTYVPEKNEWYFEPKSFSDGNIKTSEPVSSWELFLEKVRTVNAYLTEIQVTSPNSGENSTINQVNGRKINGIIMMRGAKSMQIAIGITIPPRYEAFLFTADLIKSKEDVTWQDKKYKIEEIEEIYEAYTLSYKIAKLIKPFEPWAFRN
jgi:hypothetical protein